MKNEAWVSMVVQVEGGISDVDLLWLRQRRFLKVMNLPARQTLQAVRDIWCRHEGLVKNYDGIVVSVEELDSGKRDWAEARKFARDKWKVRGPGLAEIGSSLPPLALIPRLPNSIAGHLSREFQIMGPCLTLGGNRNLDCSLRQGWRWILDGICERVMVAHAGRERAMAAILSCEPLSEGNRVSFDAPVRQ